MFLTLQIYTFQMKLGTSWRNERFKRNLAFKLSYKIPLFHHFLRQIGQKTSLEVSLNDRYLNFTSDLPLEWFCYDIASVRIKLDIQFTCRISGRYDRYPVRIPDIQREIFGIHKITWYEIHTAINFIRYWSVAYREFPSGGGVR